MSPFVNTFLTWSTNSSILTCAFDMEIPKKEGQYQLVAELTDSNGIKVRSLRDFKVLAIQE